MVQSNLNKVSCKRDKEIKRCPLTSTVQEILKTEQEQIRILFRYWIFTISRTFCKGKKMKIQ